MEIYYPKEEITFCWGLLGRFPRSVLYDLTLPWCHPFYGGFQWGGGSWPPPVCLLLPLLQEWTRFDCHFQIGWLPPLANLTPGLATLNNRNSSRSPWRLSSTEIWAQEGKRPENEQLRKQYTWEVCLFSLLQMPFKNGGNRKWLAWLCLLAWIGNCCQRNMYFTCSKSFPLIIKHWPLLSGGYGSWDAHTFEKHCFSHYPRTNYISRIPLIVSKSGLSPPHLYTHDPLKDLKLHANQYLQSGQKSGWPRELHQWLESRAGGWMQGLRKTRSVSIGVCRWCQEKACVCELSTTASNRTF